MPCTCIDRKMKYLCGCTSRTRRPRSVSCGRARDVRGRKTTCPGAHEIIISVNEYCPKSAHQRMRFIDETWRCCACGTDNQRKDRCKRASRCAHMCCSSCTQGISSKPISATISNGKPKPVNLTSRASSGSQQRSQSPCSSSTSSERLIFHNVVRTYWSAIHDTSLS